MSPTIRRPLFVSALALSAIGLSVLPLGARQQQTTRPTAAARPAATPVVDYGPPPPGLDPTLLKTFQWRSIGPERGGRSIAITGVKGQPNEGYFGATGGGLWKTTDKGETWAPVTDGQIHSSSVGAVAVSETNPDVVFIGMGESCIRGNIQPGDGVYKSTRRRQDVDARRLRRLGGDLEDPHPPDQPEHRLRRGLRQVQRAERRARHLQDHRRRQDVEAGALPRRQDRRRRHLDRPQPSRRDVRGDVGGVPHRVHDVVAAARAAGCSSPPTAASTWTEITRNPGLPRRASTARSASRCRARTRIASTRSSRTTTAASSAPTTPARRGR